MVEQLLVPVAEGQNKHKQDQLRELAVINGMNLPSISAHIRHI